MKESNLIDGSSLFLFLTESSIKSTDIDYTLYNTKQLSPDYRLHWRILKEQKEIEFIMIVNGTSWVGLGWRPRQLTAKCRNFPVILENGAAASAESVVPEPTHEPKSEPEPSGEPTDPKSVPEPPSAAEPPSSEPPSAAEPPSSEPPSAAEPPSAEPPSAEPTSEPKSEPKNKSKRANEQVFKDKDGVTVSTSVSYQVSSKAGRKRREALPQSKYKRS